MFHLLKQSQPNSGPLVKLFNTILVWRDNKLFLACSLSLCWNSSGITVLGTGSAGTTSDRFNSPRQLVIDSLGSFYVADGGNHRVQKFTASSVVGTTVAGQPGGTGGGTWGSTSFYLNQPTYVLLDSNGNLYVSDTSNHRIQYFTSGSMAGLTIAGNGKFFSPSLLHLCEINHDMFRIV